MSDTRRTVFKLLLKLENDSAFSNIILDNELSKSKFTSQEKRFVSAIFYGVAERKITLDAVINKYSKIKTNKLDKNVLQILRMGIYQLLYMDSVPESASVNESVNLAKKLKNPALSGFINGVLRTFIRDGKEIPKFKDKSEQLSVEFSCPEWLVNKWLSEYGEEYTMSLLKTSIGKAPITIRVNNLRKSVDEVIEVLSSDGIDSESTNFENCIKINSSCSIEKAKAYSCGFIHVQDISSQLCCMALEAQSGETVLDLCSAPGGKAFTIAEIMKNDGKLLAFDLHQKRVNLIKDGAERLGLSIIDAQTNNAKEFNSEIPMADRIICDVPCSGLGVIRRKPEIKYKNPADFENLPEIQYSILKTASKYLKVGGILVYSTCTVSKAENDNVVNRFLSENSDFEGVLISNKYKELSDYKATIIPDFFDSDGFFIAKLKRVR